MSTVDFPQAIWKGTQNFGYPYLDLVNHSQFGRYGQTPLVMIDHISQGTRVGIVPWFQNPASEDSSTYFLCLDGAVWQFVREANAPWTTGIKFSAGLDAYHPDLSNPYVNMAWDKKINPNLFSISVELEGYTGQVVPEAQYQGLLALHKDVFTRNHWPFDNQRILGHFQFDAVTRAQCPGTAFPWARLRHDLATSFAAPVPEINKADVGVYASWAQLRLARGSGHAADTEVRGTVGRAAFTDFLTATGRDHADLGRWGWPCS